MGTKMSSLLTQLKKIGPGAMVAAAFIGPGTVTTATIAGSSYGYTLLWAIGFSVVATIVLQEMALRLGLIGRMGIGQAVRFKIKQPIIKALASILIITAVLVGNAAYEAGNISGAVIGFDRYFQSWSFNPLVVVIAVLAFGLLYLGRYKLIEQFLVALVALMGVVFIVAAIAVKPDMSRLIQGLFQPSIPQGAGLVVVGLIGTTVVPYNLFLHASSVQHRWNHLEDLKTARWDTVLSVLLGGIITMSIMIAAAAAFETVQIKVNSAADLALGWAALMGDWAEYILTLGFLAAGLSSAITAPLAAAYATAEILGWSKDMKAFKFKMIWAGVLFVGVLFSSLGYKPTSIILLAQIANGLLLPIIAGFLWWVMQDKSIMKGQQNKRWQNILAGLVITITILLGFKGLLSAFGYL